MAAASRAARGMSRRRRCRQSQPELPGRVLAVLPTGDPAFQRGETPVDVGHTESITPTVRYSPIGWIREYAMPT